MAFSCFADSFCKDDDVPVLDVEVAFLALATPSRPRFRDLSAAAEEEDDTPTVGGGGGTRRDEPVSATYVQPWVARWCVVVTGNSSISGIVTWVVD